MDMFLNKSNERALEVSNGNIPSSPLRKGNRYSFQSILGTKKCFLIILLCYYFKNEENGLQKLVAQECRASTWQRQRWQAAGWSPLQSAAPSTLLSDQTLSEPAVPFFTTGGKWQRHHFHSHFRAQIFPTTFLISTLTKHPSLYGIRNIQFQHETELLNP